MDPLHDYEDDHLYQNPFLERSLFKEWVGVVCGWRQIATPTPDEWEALMTRWYAGKAPLQAVIELQTLREAK